MLRPHAVTTLNWHISKSTDISRVSCIEIRVLSYIMVPLTKSLAICAYISLCCTPYRDARRQWYTTYVYVESVVSHWSSVKSDQPWCFCRIHWHADADNAQLYMPSDLILRTIVSRNVPDHLDAAVYRLYSDRKRKMNFLMKNYLCEKL